MKLPIPTNITWIYRRNDSTVWHGMIWRNTIGERLVKIEPFAESGVHFPDEVAQQAVLAKFWRRLGGA